ncbi:fibronectin type III domain-containing protein [Pseudomonas moorei]|uniref:fibronectin type III domain-containing protein n=1 Tax=Pseudomonas moorei TaxID=395599 RepID=UPI0036F2F902
MDNQSNFSEPFQLVQDTTPPTIPENFRFTPPIGYRNVRVQWDESFDLAGVEGYELRRNGQHETFIPQTAYTFSGLSTKEEHTLELRAKDINGLYSEYTKIILQPRPNLINPRVTVTEFNESGIYKARLSWEFSVPPQAPVYCGYEFGDFYITSTHIEGELPGVDFEARKNEQFQFKCRIGFLGIVIGEPDLSEESTYALTFDPTPPAPVSDLKVTLRIESNISISWTRSSSQNTKYHAISLDEAPPTILPASANSYNYLFVENKAHVIDVWAISDIDVPSISEQLVIERFVEPPPEKPGTPEVSNITHSSAMFSWVKSTGKEVRYKISLNGFVIAYTNVPFCDITHLKNHADYYVEIRAFNSAGISEPATTTFKTLPSPPANLRFSHLNGRCRLAWNPVFGKSPSHEISINGRVFNTGPGRWGYNFKLEDLSPGPAPHHFTFKVRAQLDGASSEVSLLEKSLIDDAPPSQPGAPIVSNITDTSATITWAPSSDNVGVVEYLVVLNGFFVFTTQDPRYTFSKLTSGAHHYVYVRAKDKDGNLSALSKSAVFKTTGQAPLPPPSAPRVNITAETATSLTLEWGSLGGASGVRILLNDEHWRDVFLLPSMLMSNLVPNVQYTISVSTFDVLGQLSEPTVINHELKDTTPPSPPRNLRKTRTTSDSVTLTWDASTDDIGVCDYVIYNNHEYFDRTPLTQYSAIGLMSGTHRFEVLAQDLSGNLSEPTSLDVQIEGNESI